MPTFHDLLTEHIGAAFARQLAFADFLGDRGWRVNIQQGVCRFGDDLSFGMQLLGTEAEDSETWLWAWANEASNLPPSLLKSCTKLRELGTRERIPEFVDRKLPLDSINGHSISLAASGLDGRVCYYRGPYDGGALFFLVTDLPESLFQPVDAARAITVIMEVISQFELDHRTMTNSFLKSQGFELTPGGQQTVAVRGADKLTLQFDELGRLANLEGNVRPQSPPPAKPWWRFW